MTDEEKKISKKESAKKWRDKNKDSIKEKAFEYNKEYYAKNKILKGRVLLTDEEVAESKKDSARKWRENNKEYNKEYQSDNYERISEYQKEYREVNKESLNEKHLINKKKRYESDEKYKLKTQIRTIVYKSFKRNGFKKNSKTSEILGCSFEEFRLYLESKFEDWMNWENKGLFNNELNYGWDIDHIIPLSSAKTQEELVILNHYSNLQPLCSKINRHIKKDNLNYEMA